MKKRCTVPSCRRVFTPRQTREGVVCPHCGKVYSRVSASPGTQVFLELFGRDPEALHLPSIKMLRSKEGLGLRRSKEIMDALNLRPHVLGPMSRTQAAAEVDDWARVGIRARILGRREDPRAVRRMDYPCRVVLSGCDAGSRTKVTLLIQSATGQTLKECDGSLRSLLRGSVLLAENLTNGQAQELLAKARTAGATAHLEWEKRA